MFGFADRLLRRHAALALVLLGVIVCGTYAIMRVATDHLLNANATLVAGDWAGFVAANVADLEQIASGEQPSAASMAFFRSTRRAGQVFRYIIFNRAGYSQLIADHDQMGLVDLSEHSAKAARAAATGMPIVDVSDSRLDGVSRLIAEAYVPVLIDRKPVAVVAAYLDETRQRLRFRDNFIAVAAAICLLTALSFGIPALAWYRSTAAKLRADRQIRFLARHDVLTGLANRTVFLAQLTSAVAEAGRHVTAVLCLDLDRFKQVNDTLGHQIGDALLRAVSGRLVASVRDTDTVARFGGDEFAIVQVHAARPEDAQVLAERILAAVELPFLIEGHQVVVGTSIGIALAPGDSTDAATLLKCADMAMYRAKADGGGTFRFFEANMDARLQSRRQLELDLRNALAAQEFELAYQPMMDLGSHHVTGFEALLRWRHPLRGIVPPAEFIPVAEETGLIIPLGEWVVRQACAAAAAWPGNVKVAVNLSAVQFKSRNLVTAVSRALTDAGLDGHRLELEITESVLLLDNAATLATLHKLHALGIQVSMDDFGTGYSSLSYLRQFPFDKIKIDQCFVRGLAHDQDSVEIVRAIVALGKALRMRVVAEGVETEEQFCILEAEGCDELQGYLFSRPHPLRDVQAMISDLSIPGAVASG